MNQEPQALRLRIGGPTGRVVGSFTPRIAFVLSPPAQCFVEVGRNLAPGEIMAKFVLKLPSPLVQLGSSAPSPVVVHPSTPGWRTVLPSNATSSDKTVRTKQTGVQDQATPEKVVAELPISAAKEVVELRADLAAELTQKGLLPAGSPPSHLRIRRLVGTLCWCALLRND